MNKVFVMMLHILWIFGLPASAAYFTGRWLDQTYFIRPMGSVLAGAVALTISWIATFKLYKQIKADYRALDKITEQRNKAITDESSEES